MRLPDPGTSTRIILIRHAEAHDSYVGRCYGSLDVPLSDDGRRQAEQLPDRLLGQRIGAVVSSPRRRAVDTALPLTTRLGLALEVEPDLRELDFGSFEGRTYAEIEQQHPEIWHQWMTEPTGLRFPGGESYEDLRSRVSRAVTSVRRSRPGTTTALVAHGGVVRSILADALGLPSPNIFRLDQGYGAVNVVDWFEETPVVRLVNG